VNSELLLGINMLLDPVLAKMIDR